MFAPRRSLVVLTCAALAVSCVQSSASPPEIDRDEVRAPGAEGPEPIAEARDPFGSKDFRFVVVLQDDGTDSGGGWQKANARLRFAHVHLGIPVRPEWDGPDALFCVKLVDRMRQLFRDEHPGVGATVARL